MSSLSSRGRAVIGVATAEHPSTEGRSSARASGLRRRAHLAIGLIVLLVVGFGVWAVTVPISGAIIAPGHVVVEQNSKRIQHPTGGVISEILVVNGQGVRAGEVMLRLDDTQASATYEALAARLVQLRGERARIVAERDRLPSPRFDELSLAADKRTAAVIAGEQGYFEARRALVELQKSRLRQKIEQVRGEIRAIEAQRTAKGYEVELIRQELVTVEDMSRRQLSNITRLTEVRRQLARFEGEQAALAAQHARGEAQVSEVELQIVELEQRALTEAHRELGETDVRIAELVERKKAANDQLLRAEVRAPASGVVHELAMHTIGGVVRAGDTILKVVPDSDALGIEARVAIADVDHVAVGGSANLRLAALDRRSTSELTGTVVHVGADSTRDPATARYYYVIRIAIPESERRKLGSFKLVPGMPVESFIETAPRTLLSYLLKPLRDNLARTMREP